MSLEDDNTEDNLGQGSGGKVKQASEWVLQDWSSGFIFRHV